MVYFTDPIGDENYFQIIDYINSEKIQSYFYNDEFNNGLNIERNLNNRNREVEFSDTVKIEMRCISKEVYEYLDDLHSRSGMSASPIIPKTNIENAKIGYFSAHTSETKFLVY